MPPLGWISPKDRTNEQHDAHAKAMAAMPKFAIPGHADPAGPVKVMLTDFWKKPEVVADVGFAFTGFHQLTGSCVGASSGNAVATLAAVQRCISGAPTKAMVPWWPFSYGRTRLAEGDRGQGEGAIDSVMGQTLAKEGVFAITESGLPQFKTDDGLYLTNALEMQWSDGSRIDPKWGGVAKEHPVGGMAPLNNPADIKAAVLNGYPVLDGCELYVGHGSIKGSGDNAYVAGHYDGRGGHSTCILGYWDHPNDGPLYLYSNQWPTQTYPTDPAGAGRCCVWIPESEMAKLFTQYGGDNGETMALSHLNWFPAQNVLDWLI
jgi:hypothetical protein